MPGEIDKYYKLMDNFERELTGNAFEKILLHTCVEDVKSRIETFRKKDVRRLKDFELKKEIEKI